MSEQERPQNDFFNDLMFGRTNQEPPVQDTSEQQPTNDDNESDDTLNAQPTQLEQILTLVQTIGPALDKLAPLMGVVHTFFTKQKKEQPKKENADE